MVEVDALAGRNGIVPVFLDRLTDPCEPESVQRAVDDRNAHHCVYGDTKADLKRRYSQVE